MSAKRYRNWVFTLNNPEDNGVPLPNGSDWFARFEHLRYGICQLERGSEGTLHLQGYLEFDRSIRASSIQSALPGSYHSRRMGSRQQAIDYCQKEETRQLGPWIFVNLDL